MLELYKKRLNASGTHMGDALKKQSDMIMDKTFTRDIAYRKCFIDGKPIDAKYIVHTYYTISKDAVDYHLQFRPGVHYPIGTYIDVPDDIGEYHTWLIVARSDEPQFVKYNILKCNWTFRWMDGDIVRECLGVLRSRNSYNSGLWLDYYMTIPENQNQFIVPTNEITQTIDYNTRFLISDNKIHPIAWEVSKREDMFPTGVTWITLKQSLFNPDWDNMELMIANYFKRNNKEPAEGCEDKEYKIVYSGTPHIKAGGSFKTYELIPSENCTWNIIGIDESKLETKINSNIISIKILSDYSLIGTVFKLNAVIDEEVVASIDIEVISL